MQVKSFWERLEHTTEGEKKNKPTKKQLERFPRQYQARNKRSTQYRQVCVCGKSFIIQILFKMVWICGSLQQQQHQPVLHQRSSGPCPCAGHKWPVKSQRHSWVSAFSFHQLQNICHSRPTLGKVTPASLKNKDKLMFLHQLCLRNE